MGLENVPPCPTFTIRRPWVRRRRSPLAYESPLGFPLDDTTTRVHAVPTEREAAPRPNASRGWQAIEGPIEPNRRGDGQEVNFGIVRSTLFSFLPCCYGRRSQFL